MSLLDPFKAKQPTEDDKGPSKKDLWLVAGIIVVLLAVLLIQRL